MAEIVKLTREAAEMQGTLEGNISIEIMKAQEAGMPLPMVINALSSLLAFALCMGFKDSEDALSHIRETMPVHLKHAREQHQIVQKIQRGGRLDG